MQVFSYWASPKSLIFLLYVLVLQSFIKKLSIHEFIPLLGIWDELLVLYILLPATITLKKIIRIRQGSLFLIFLILYFSTSIISSLFGNTEFVQSIYQLVLDSKYAIIILFCIGAYRPGMTEQLFGRFIKTIILLNIPLVLFQFYSPGDYDNIFQNGAHSGSFILSNGDKLPRAAGIFWSTGALADFGVASAAFFSIRILSGTISAKDKIFLFLSLFLLLSTLSRGEIIGFILGLIAVYFFFHTKPIVKPFAISFIIAGSSLAYLTLDVYFFQALVELGLLSGEDDLAPRAIFMLSAIQIASNHFPLGAGLGAFGGASAVVYDSSLFYTYNISDTWFFKQGLYLTDTYWPKVIAESGFFGAGLNFILVTIPIYYCINVRKISFPVRYSLLMCVFLLVNSFSAPKYGDTFITLICFVMIGSSIPHYFASKFSPKSTL